MKIYTRNTPAERICRECWGSGVHTVNPSNPHGYGPDPQQDRDVQCETCAGIGWIRVIPEDPINNLSEWRRMYRNNPTAWGYRYGQCRQRVVSPVNLPDLRK